MSESNSTLGYVETMLQMQIELEDLMHPDWRQASIRPIEAIVTEVGEVLEELQFKWWIEYDEPVNMGRLHAELIDVWHFILLNHAYYEIPLPLLHAPTVYHAPLNKEQGALVRKLLTSFLGLAISKRTVSMDNFLNICALCGLSAEKLFEEYCIKHVVNTVRTEIRATYGTYDKMAFGMPDSTWAQERWKELSGTTESKRVSLRRLLFNSYAIKQAL